MLDETPKGPSPEEQLERERADRARAEQELRERQAAYEARLEEMDRSMRRQATPAPTPMTAAKAQEELGLSADDIQKDPDKALKALEDHIRKQAVQEATAEVESRYGGLVSNLSNQAVNLELEQVKNQKYWHEAQAEVARYFEDHPDEMTPGRVTEVYRWCVGQNHEQYEAAHRERQSKDQASTSEMRQGANAAAEPPPRRSAGSRLDVDEKGPEPELTEEEETVRQAYNAHGANISKREWVAISEGRLIPKKRASDWDAGYYKTDRKVARYEG